MGFVAERLSEKKWKTDIPVKPMEEITVDQVFPCSPWRWQMQISTLQPWSHTRAGGYYLEELQAVEKPMEYQVLPTCILRRTVNLWRTHAWSRFILEGLHPVERTHSGAVLCWGRVEVWGEGAAESTGYRLTATPYSLSSLCPLRMGEVGKSVENGGLNLSLERTRGCGKCFSFCLCF